LDFLKIIQVDPGQDVVLASDGYPVLGDDLAATEKILNDCLMADPLMIDRYPQIKGLMKGQVSFDDRAYVRFRSGN
jgi:glycerophosphoryl diester phosphodiesterase